MTSSAGQKLIAIVECLAPMLDDEQIEIAIVCLMRLAGQGSTRAEEERRGRERDRTYEEYALVGDAEASARRSREPA